MFFQLTHLFFYISQGTKSKAEQKLDCLIQPGFHVKWLQESNYTLSCNNVLCQLYTTHLYLHRCTSLHKTQQQQGL